MQRKFDIEMQRKFDIEMQSLAENLILKCKEYLTLLPNRFIQSNGIFLSHPIYMSLNYYPVNSFG